MKTQTFLLLTLTLVLVFFVSSGFKADKQPSRIALKMITAYHNNFEVEPEEELNVESWMTDDSCWKMNSENISITEFDFEDSPDEHLAIESWMTDDNLWQF